MPTTNLVFPASSHPGIRPQESGGRLINAFAEKAPEGSPSDLIHRRSAGLQRLATTLSSRIHTRGFLDGLGTANALMWIVNERVLKIDSVYVVTDIGALGGTLPVTTAINNAVTKQAVVVTGSGAFNLLESSAPTAFADADLPNDPTSVCGFDGYFIFSYADGRIFASDLNSVSVSSLSFNTEQGLEVRRVVRYAGRLYAFGDKWTAVYRNAGTSPFPLAREVTIPRGIIGTHAVAGWEPGWANELIWAGDDYIVYRLQGYTPVPISTNAVSRDIEQAARDIKGHLMVAQVYMHEQNAFWTLTSPEDWTWEFNLTTGQWNERQSYNRNDWRGKQTVFTRNRWLIGDEYDGNLYEIDGDYHYEDIDPLIWQVESGVSHGFPRGMVIPRTSFHITAGVGAFETVEDPTVLIQWSLDGGHSYGHPVARKLGGPGKTRGYPYILNTGLSRGQGVRYRLRVSDPVHVGLMGGVIEAERRLFA